MNATIRLLRRLGISATFGPGLNPTASRGTLVRWHLPVLMLGVMTLTAPAQYQFRTEANSDGTVTITGANLSLALPRDLGTVPWLLEEMGDSRPSNVNNWTPDPPRLLQSNGTSSMQNGSVVNSGPLFSNQNFPYVMLDAKRNVLLMHPELKKSACVGFVVGCPGRYRFTGAFARANNFQSAGDGVDVAILLNTEVSRLLFQRHIASYHPVNADDPFVGDGVAHFDLALDLVEGDILRFAVFCGPQGRDMSFDVTAFQLRVSRPTEVHEDGNAAAGGSLCPCGSLEIPDTVDGRRVTRIGDGAFSGCPTLTSVTIPGSVTSIGDGAFRDCGSLKEAHFEGNAPDIAQGQPFDSPTTIYYRPGMAGWGPLFSGRPTAERWPDDAFAVGADGTVTIVRGACPTGAVTIPEAIEGRKVTSIGYRAFFRCTGLTNVTIGNGVTRIGFDAFHGCTGLTSIAIPNSVTTIDQQAFFGCAGLSSITLPEGITTIGSQAFTECGSLRSITIPGSAANLSPGAFFYCQGLTNVMIGDGVPSIAQGLFGGCTQLIRVTIPGSVTNIGSWAFNDCRSLTSVTIPDSVNSIGEYAFCNCGSLTSIVIPDRATGIGTKTFWSCSQMTNCTIGNGVTTIGDEAFAGCSSLATITLPAGVTNIGQRAFGYCSSLGSVTLPDNVISIGDSAFRNCSGLARILIGARTTTIGDFAFFDCTNVSEISVDAANPVYLSLDGVLFDRSRSSLLQFPSARIGRYAIPSGVTNVVAYAFWQSQGLTGVDFPDSVTVIGNTAFADCPRLRTVTIGSGVTTIGPGAFSGCTNLTKVTIPASVTSIQYSAFERCGDSLDAYFEGSVPYDTVHPDDPFRGRVFGSTASYHYIPGFNWWDPASEFGAKATVWRPQVIAGEGAMGAEAGRTALTITWARGRSVVIEASADLGSPAWTPISTNTLTDGWVQFTDPDWRSQPARFYRVQGH